MSPAPRQQDSRSKRRTGEGRSERGFALITVVFILVILTLMGLSFLILADTENKISVQNRNDQQVLYVAEAGARVVVSWFHQPDPMRNPLVPSTDEVDRSRRVADSDYDGIMDIDVPANGSVDYYRGGAMSGGTRLFDKPYHKYTYATLWAPEETPEILIQDDPEDPDDYLSELNVLFNPEGIHSLGRVRITEIRVYGPPKDDELATRYGVASLMVTAVREARDPGGGGWRVVARRTVRQVLNDLPFPPSIGAIETAGSINESGSMAVHWGGSYAEENIDPPSGANFPGPSVPREDTSRNRWADFSTDAPDLDLAEAGTQNLVEQLLQEPFEIPDPWLLFRAAGGIVDAPNSNDQPWPYQYAVGVADDRSSYFQNQTYRFPHVDYEIWKEISKSGYKNINYFAYAGTVAGGPEGTPVFTRNGQGEAREFEEWVNTQRDDVEPGIFFFDTKNGLNPQEDGPGILTEPIALNSANLPGINFITEGFVFLNASSVGSTGLGGKTVTHTVNMPSEPFLDEGLDLDGDGKADGTTAGNGIWDFDLDGDTESDGENWSDLYGTATFNQFETDHRFAHGEIPHDGFDPGTLETFPHEPFLNLRYPDKPDYGDPLPVDFDAEVLYPREMGGDRDGNGTTDRMTSLRDYDGALVNLPLNVHGIFYNEGGYFGDGNIAVFGSMLFKAGFESEGTPDVWFDESILKGGWPPVGLDIPRVFVTQTETSK